MTAPVDPRPAVDAARDVVVVVAAGPGLGRAVAERFAREGADVALVARSEQPLRDLTAQVARHGTRVTAAVADAADEASLRGALAAVRDALGAPTVLVFNASVYVEGRPSELAYDALMHGLRVGVGAAVVAVQEVAPAMRTAGRGTILLTGSEAALNPSVRAAGLGMAKAALRNLAFSAAAELGPDGVHVTTVTIRGMLAAGTAFDPDVLAERYWQLHGQPPEQWQPELTIGR
ncbi:MAG: hypothetical protein QOC93_119 [Actinomycetota bacterium]|nr:hypothetical protein [Actinomycetota bacterium]